MNLQIKWYKVKHLDSNGEVTQFIVNFPQLITMMIGLVEGEFLEFTPTNLGSSFVTDKD